MNIHLAHWLDRHVGLLLCGAVEGFRRFRPKRTGAARTALQPTSIPVEPCSSSDFCRFAPRPQRPARPRRLLVLKFWGMGSIIQTQPALACFRQRHPDCEIHLVTLRQNLDVTRLIPEIDTCWTLDLAVGPARYLAETVRLLSRLRRMRFDLAVDLEFFTKFSALFSGVLPAECRVGFIDRLSWRGHPYDLEIPFNSYWHVSANFAHALLGSGFDPADLPPARVEMPPEAEAPIRNRLAREGWIEGRQRLVVINPHAGALSLLRRWPTEHFVELLIRLTHDPTLFPVLIGSPGEASYASALLGKAACVTGLARRPPNLSGALSLTELAGLLRMADLLITNDSGPLHLAAALGTPTVSFFGPETPVLYGPRGGNHRVLFRNIGCSPCINVLTNKTPRCLHDENVCLSRISADKAMAAVREILKP